MNHDSAPHPYYLNQFTKIFQTFNELCEILFTYLKYIFVIIFIFSGISTLLNYKHFKADKQHIKYGQKDLFFNKIRLILGIFFLFAGVGFLFNYFLYLLILLLDPLPDQFIYNFLNLGKGQNEILGELIELASNYSVISKSTYYCFALCSFEANLRLILLCYFLSSRRKKIVAIKSFIIGLEALIQALFFGFTTYLKLMI